MTAFETWLRKIGAEQDNFRRWSVRATDPASGYPSRQLTIRVKADGTLEYPESFSPTLDELLAIEEELKTLVKSFPKHVKVGPQTLGLLNIDPASQTYQFWDRATDQLIMIQERRIMKDGRKAYIPHTFWSDGVWRTMQPDRELLPFFKPRYSTNKTKIMVHEGAKAADFCNRIHELAPDHPWREELEQYEHWGMIGGAIIGQQICDMGELRAAQPELVVYVCDNDFPGKRVIDCFSRRYRDPLKYIFFYDNYPTGWDLADPMPTTFDNRSERKLSWKMQPATWATEKIPDSKPSKYRCTEQFVKEWFCILELDLFVHADRPNLLLSNQAFNSWVRPFSDVDDTGKILKRTAIGKSHSLIYDPSSPPGIYNTGQMISINTHVPGFVVPKKGDIKPWLDFMHHLIPDKEDCHEVMRWVATLIARPDVKMAYALLLISSTQGVGKSTLGSKVLSPILGRHNVSEPSESTIVDSDFTDWMGHKRLAVCHEIYAGHSAKAYNKLKSIITDDVIQVNKKFVPTYTTQNWLHVIACSNSERALRLENDDRRYLVPKVTEEHKPHSYWVQFNKWLAEDGLSIIMNWADEFCKIPGNVVIPGDGAPWTNRKTEVIQENYSPGQQVVSEFFDNVKAEFNGDPIIMYDQDIVDLIRERLYDGKHNDRLEKPMTVRKIAKFKGYHCGKKQVWDKRSRRLARTITNKIELLDSSSEELESSNIVPLDIKDLARKWSTL